MIIAIDFDGTLVEQDRPYDDLTTPPELRPGALDALKSMKAAGHIHLLWSARTNRALLYSPRWDPLYSSGIVAIDQRHWKSALDLHWARFRQMTEFVERELPGLIDEIDPGLQGKPCVDLFIDDRTPSGPIDWDEIRARYGAW